MHPALKDGVSLGTFQYKDSEVIHYYVENADNEEFEINCRLWNALLNADGTHPLNLPDNGRKILPVLKEHGLVRTSRFVRDDGIFNRLILFPVGNRIRCRSLVCKAVNAALPVLSVLVFAMSMYLMKSNHVDFGNRFNWWLYCVFVICSLVFHEVGHLVACLAYGYKICDIGILLLGIFPIGAYVAHEDKKEATKAEKVQLSLAGVEANLLLSGICLLVAMQYYPISLLMGSIAILNVVLAGINLLPTLGLDGESALSAVFEVNSIGETAKMCLCNKKRRQMLLSSGFAGFICFFVFAITLISKVLFWLIIGYEIVSIFYHLL